MRLYVGNLGDVPAEQAEATADALFDMFAAYGGITCVTIKGRFGFVDYTDDGSARCDDAVADLNETLHNDQPLVVEYCKSESKAGLPRALTVHVAGLPDHFTWQSLEDLVGATAQPTSTHTFASSADGLDGGADTSQPGPSKGWVHFSTTEDALQCYQALNGTTVEGSLIDAFVVDTTPMTRRAPGEARSGHPRRRAQQPGGEGYAGPGMGGMDPGQSSMCFLVPSKMVGAIIGKSGTIIRSISTETGTKFDIQKREDARSRDRTIVIMGEPEAISAAYVHVATKLQAEALANGQAAGIEAAVPLQMLVPNEVVGHVIGKKGSHLKQVMAASGALVHINSKEDAMYTSQRTITVSGPVESICAAQAMLTEKIASVVQSMVTDAPPFPTFVPQMHPGMPMYPPPASPMMFWYDQPEEKVHFYVPSSSVGAIIGKGGSNIKEMMRISGAIVRVLKPDADAGEYEEEPMRTVVVVGSGDAQVKAQQLVFLRTSETLAMYGNPVDAPLTMEVHLASNVVGRVIGKSGQKIREIVQRSGAHVQIPPNSASDDAETTVVTVAGTFSQCQAAQQLIREVLLATRMRDVPQMQ